MGRRGPARTPDAIKLARGETRPSRLNGLEPLPRASRPTMPKGMDERARAVWRLVLREMGDSGVITGADAFVLRLFCEAYSAYERDAVMLFGSGPLIRGRRGNELVRNPLAQIVRDEREAARLLMRELGLTPAARANLSVSGGGALPDLDADLGPPPRLRVVADGP